MTDAAEISMEILKKNGWRQGCIVPEHLSRELLSHGIPSDADAVIVVSHDCDVTHHSLDSEPYVEVLIARRVEQLNGAFTDGKNPRKLHFEVVFSENVLQPMEACAHDRILVPRRLFMRSSPDGNRSCSSKTIEQIGDWLSRRYNRVALPDNFNDRLKPVQSKIKKLMKEGGVEISGLYLSLNLAELPDSENYQIAVIATMRMEDCEIPTKREQAELVLGQIETIVSECRGIEIVSADLKGEDEVSPHDLRLLTRWDTYDYLSP